MFKYLGTIKHNGQIISSSGQFEQILKDKLYREDRDEESMCLSLSSERVLVAYESYDMTLIVIFIEIIKSIIKVHDWIRIPTELGPYIKDENISQAGFQIDVTRKCHLVFT